MMEKRKAPGSSRGRRGLLCVAAVSLALLGAAILRGQTAPPHTSKERRSGASDPNQLLGAAQAALRRQDYLGAINDLTPLIKTYPNVADVWFDLAYADTGLHRNDAAVSAYEKAIKLEPKLFPARLNLGILLVFMNRPADALPHLKEAVALRPGDARAHLYLGRAENLTGNKTGAEAELQAAARLQPTSAAAFLELGQLDFRQKDYAGARDAFEKAATLDPNLAEAELGAGISLANLKQDALAAPYLKRYLKAKPEDTKTRFDLARIEIYLGQYPQAVADLTAIEKADPSLPGLNEAFGEVYAKLEQFPASEKYYRLALAASPAQPQLRVALGDTLMHEKNFAGAEAEFRAALKLSPADRDAAVGLAASLYFQKRYADAIPLLQQIVQAPPAEAGNFFFLGASFDHLHDLRPAIAAYQKFLSLSAGKEPDQEWQAQQRIKLLKHELER